MTVILQRHGQHYPWEQGWKAGGKRAEKWAAVSRKSIGPSVIVVRCLSETGQTDVYLKPVYVFFIQSLFAVHFAVQRCSSVGFARFKIMSVSLVGDFSLPRRLKG